MNDDDASSDVEAVTTAAAKRPVLSPGQDERESSDDCTGQKYATNTNKHRHVLYLSETQSDGSSCSPLVGVGAEDNESTAMGHREDFLGIARSDDCFDERSSGHKTPTSAGNIGSPTSTDNAGAIEGKSCQFYYDTVKQRDKKVLLAMCLGLNTDCLAYCDTDVDVVYKNSLKKQHFCPSRVILIEECSRCNSSGTPMHCKSKKVQQLKKWLIANPIMDEADVKFLRLEESKFCQSLVAAVSEHQQQAELHSESGTSWIGPKPFLWLAHVLLEEDVIVLFRKAHE